MILGLFSSRQALSSQLALSLDRKGPAHLFPLIAVSSLGDYDASVVDNQDSRLNCRDSGLWVVVTGDHSLGNEGHKGKEPAM